MNPIAQRAKAAHLKYLLSESAYKQALIFILEIQVEAYQESERVKRICDEFEVVAKRLDLSSRDYFRCATFFSLVASMEIFLQELIKSVIREHPKKIGATQFKLSEILDIGSEDELINKAIDDYLNKVMYKKPSEYLAEICEVLSIEKTSIAPHWPAFVEAKARRDVGIHNDWRCNETYLRKCTEANFPTTAKIGERIIPSDKDYIFSSSAAMRSVVEEFAKLVISVHSKAN